MTSQLRGTVPAPLPPRIRSTMAVVSSVAVWVLAIPVIIFAFVVALRFGSWFSFLVQVPVLILALGLNVTMVLPRIRDPLYGVTPPPGFTYEAEQWGLDAMLAPAGLTSAPGGVGLTLAGRRYANVIRGEVSGLPMMYFEAVNSGARHCYIVLALPGQLARLDGHRHPAMLTHWNDYPPVLRRPLRKVAGYWLKSPEPLPPGYLDAFVTPDVEQALSHLSMLAWRIGDRYLTGVIVPGSQPKAKALGYVMDNATQLATFAHAIPRSLFVASVPHP